MRGWQVGLAGIPALVSAMGLVQVFVWIEPYAAELVGWLAVITSLSPTIDRW